MIIQHTVTTHYPAVDLTASNTTQGKFNLILELVEESNQNITAIYLKNGSILLEIDGAYDYTLELDDLVFYDSENRSFRTLGAASPERIVSVVTTTNGNPFP